MGLSSVRVDTGGGGCVQTKMRFFTIFGERGADFEFWIFNFGCVKSGEPFGSRDEEPIVFFGNSVFAATQLRRDRKVPSSD